MVHTGPFCKKTPEKDGKTHPKGYHYPQKTGPLLFPMLLDGLLSFPLLTTYSSSVRQHTPERIRVRGCFSFSVFYCFRQIRPRALAASITATGTSASRKPTP